MIPELSDIELRVIGCLIEKSVVTPDQYPLTLNALTIACNQKSSRDPVMALTQGEVQHAVRALQTKHLLMVDENFKSRTEKYTQRFCNTRYSELQFDEAERAIVCLLLLRGAHTPGELRARAGRLHSCADNQAVVESLEGLMHRDAGPLVVQLPRTPGRRDAAFMHLFAGPVDEAAFVAAQEPASRAVTRPAAADETLIARVEALEAEVAALKLILAQREP